MEQVLQGVARAHDAQCVLRIMEEEYTPAVINDERMTAIAREAIQRGLPQAQISSIRPIMVSEDMSEVMNRVPGCYVLLGAEPEGGARGPHHNPRFDMNGNALPLAAAVMAAIATHFLTSWSETSRPETSTEPIHSG
jgi:amidohydrolase